MANDLIHIFSRLFVDLARNTCLLMLKDKHFHVVFRVIEIELGLMYDLLYTKAKVIHNRWGCALRAASILLTGMVLVLFSLSDKAKYSKVNVYVTFLLLWVAIFLEVYAVLVLLFSDKAACWLKNHSLIVLEFVERLQPLYNRHRWSGSMAQFNLLSFALSKRRLAGHQILEWLRMDEKVLKFFFKRNVRVEDFLKERIMEHVKSQVTSQKEVPSVWTYRGDLVLGRDELLDTFKWSIDFEFDQSILVWHIASELLCNKAPPDHARLNYAMSKQLSRYMLYLLVMYPFLLPIGAERGKFRDTCAEVISFLNEHESRKKTLSDLCHALTMAFEEYPTKILGKGEKSKFTLYHGCRLAVELDKEVYDQEKRWEIISCVWVEMLVYAAVKCQGVQHARQLRRGGEFLTHVWFLMAHFGLTDHFQVQHAPAIAEMLVKRY